MSTSVNILFPHQLFREHELLHNGHPVYLVEEFLFFRLYRFHKVKLAYHRATMQAYADALRAQGVDVHYIDSTQSHADIRELIPYLKAQGVTLIHFIDPTDHWLNKRLTEAAVQQGLSTTVHKSPLFINSKPELDAFFKPTKKSFFQTSFYKQQRVRHQLLLDHKGQPLGGQWSYDADNRKPYPKKLTPPAIPSLSKNSYWTEATAYIQEHFPDHPGQLSSYPLYPITHQQAEHWFQRFLSERFYAFGDYEDAIHQQATVLHHSVLTPMLNIGLLQPMSIVQKAIAFAEANNTPLNSLEGFVRQIIGWREFIRGMYECKGTTSRTRNFWNFSRPIPASFYDGTTGILPLDHTIRQVLKSGYSHHIERLMVLGNFMLLCEFDPDEVYQWFMELFIDAYDWVMVPNVYGMSQFADGGLFATKPYISGSNYLMKMSNYPKGDWQLTWDGLFWRFMHVHRDFFLKNPRLSMLIRSFDRMTPAKQQTHLANAETFLQQLDA